MLNNSDYTYVENNHFTPLFLQNISLKKIQIAVKQKQRNIYRASIQGDAQMIQFYQNALVHDKAASLLAVYKSMQLHNYQSNKAELKQGLFLNIKYGDLFYNHYVRYMLRNEKVYIQEYAIQMVLLLALQPEWEARTESNVYGFSTGSALNQAIIKTYGILSQNSDYENSLVIVGRLNNWFDNLDLDFVLKKTIYKGKVKKTLVNLLELFPLNLAAQVMYDKFQSSNIISFSYNSIALIVANIFLYGLEMSLSWKFHSMHYELNQIKAPDIKTIIYSNHFLIMFSSKNLKNIALAINTLDSFFQPTRQTLNVKSYNVSFVHEGFDFLGFHFKRSRNHQTWNHEATKLLLKPTKNNVKKHLLSLRKCLYHKDRLNRWRANSHMTQSDVINKLNPLIQKFSYYYQNLVPSSILIKIDRTLNEIIYRYAIKKYKSNRYEKWKHNWTEMVHGRSVIGYKDISNNQYKLLLLHYPR
uniref:putative reverse transcriptase/maturase n=1 Tax=Pseudoerythrocladia kornmannii TaxID=753682 RepID=UPI001BF15D33|nr:putative reverse transcriptase/maturase [Pseudoerythrocladia kornmannii]QUE28259.1 mat [Pseudoerythrocladia kornmannii]UNJ16763.1 putative reverse transcriptase/maturase [Pseudoerythrocladia kornmannii]